MLGSLDELEARFPGVVAAQRRVGTRALVAWPLPGVGSPVGGLVLFFDEDQAFPEAQRQLIEAAARPAPPTPYAGSGSRGGRDEAERPLEKWGAVLAWCGLVLALGGRASCWTRPYCRPARRGRFLRRQLTGWGIDPEP